jgi:flagellar biosynthesis/type III secretory pathway protein FliH
VANFWVYSVEPMPRVDLFATRDHNPANEYIGYNGIYIAPVEPKTWTRIPDKFRSLRHRDRTDKQGTTYHVFDDEIVKANQERLRPRGVLFTDHEPTAEERKELEERAAKLNMQFRLDTIQSYEEAMREAEANGRTVKAPTYVKECYELLGMPRPGSAEAIRAQRQPGEDVADRIVAALEKLLSRKPDVSSKQAAKGA